MNITFGSGITIGSGIGINTTPGAGGGSITLTFTEFDYPSGPPIAPPSISIQDLTAAVTGTGIVINNPALTGVAMIGLTTPNMAFVTANLPDYDTSGNGEIWTANWSGGSTYATTPIAAYYSSSVFAGGPTFVYWILDPADGSYTTGAAGTFNFPVTLTAGTTTTSFTQP